MAVCIIPARGGSKRIPRKNLKDFHGRPMIAWSIVAALESGCFDRVIVSTDDEEISNVAREWGAETPFIRPRELSDDHTGTIAVVRHAAEWLSNAGETPASICCLYATAPFVRPSDLSDGLTALERGARYAFSATSFAFPIQRALRIVERGGVEMIQPEHALTRSQDLEDVWHDAGQFYWANFETWVAEEPIFTPNSTPIIIPRRRAQDIDTPEDWEMAEAMFSVMG